MSSPAGQILHVSLPRDGSSNFLPRQRNLWLTVTFEWRLEARLGQSANLMPEYSGLGFFVRSHLALEPGFPPPVNAASGRSYPPSHVIIRSTRPRRVRANSSPGLGVGQNIL